MDKTSALWLLLLVLALALLAGCSSSGPPTPAALSDRNLNLIFVVSEDLAYHAAGDVNPKTANLTDQGLQRSLSMATFLAQQVLAGENVTAIYAIEPMTHLQTMNNYPDMVAPETIQQFALLNQVTLSGDPKSGIPYSGHSFPLNASYSSASIPRGVAVPSQFCPNCQGLDFKDEEGDNEALVSAIVTARMPGFYVFSAPWETASALLANINQSAGYNLAVPPRYMGPNYIYVISISLPSGSASMITYNSNLNPPSAYPVLPMPPLASTPCTAQKPFSITVTGGQGGAVVPAGTNTNETIYIIRHADAHPLVNWDDNNYVGAGQWRALDLPNALRGKISPNQVYSIDPAQFGPGSVNVSTGDFNWSTVAPSLTAGPYAIANNLPYHLVSSLLLTDHDAPKETSAFLFTGGALSNQKVLLAWAYQYIQPTVNALLDTYHGDGPPAPPWPSPDYDTIWTVRLDAQGNVTVSNVMCEGINSAALPASPPQF